MVDEELPALTPEIVAAALEKRKVTATSGQMPPPPDDRRPRPWGLLIGVVAGLVVIFFLFKVALGGNEDQSASQSTTTVATESTAGTTSSTSTTSPPTTTTTAATTTTATTTTTTTSTTTTTTTTLPQIEAVGDPVPISDLTLGAFALGPFSFDASTSYLGRLVASLGQPDSRREVGTDMGLCEGDTGVAYAWGGLTAIFRVDNDAEILVGYRLISTGGDEPTQHITTKSGLALGHTIEKLNAIYLQSGVAFANIDGKPHFILLRSTDNATLLWGPVSSTDSTGIVEGIYSPRPCDRGPTATP
jgi:hypothetical protein